MSPHSKPLLIPADGATGDPGTREHGGASSLTRLTSRPRGLSPAGVCVPPSSNCPDPGPRRPRAAQAKDAARSSAYPALRSNPSVGTSSPVLPAAHTAPPTILLKGSLRAVSPLQLYAHDDDLLRLKAFSTLHGLRASRFLPPGQTSLRHPSLATQLPAQLLHIEARRLQ